MGKLLCGLVNRPASKPSGMESAPVHRSIRQAADDNRSGELDEDVKRQEVKLNLSLESLFAPLAYTNSICWAGIPDW